MAEGGGAAAGGGTGANYRLSATLEMNDQLTGKLRGAASQLKSIDGAVAKLGSRGEVAKLARQFDSLNNLSKQVDQFKQLKKSVSATQQAYNEANSTTAQLAKQYKSGQSVVAQLTAKHNELKNTFNTSQAATAQLKDKLSGLKVEAAKFKSSGATEEYQKLQNQIKATSAELKSSQAMTRSTGAELKTLAGGVKQAQRELTNIGNAFEQSKAKARSLKQELATQQPALSQMRQSLAAQGFNTRDFAASERQLRQRIAETSQRIYAEQRQQQLRNTLTAAGMTVSNPRPIPVNVGGNATSTLGKIKNQLNSITNKTWNVAVNAKNAVGGKMNEFANGAAMGMGAQVMGVAGLGYGVMDAVNTYKEFEYQMATVKAITGANAEQFEILTKRAKELGATTMFKASEVGKAEEYMGMAGWKTEQIDKGLPAVLNLAAASGEDLARVSDIVTDSMTAFGLKATDVVKTADGKIVQATDHFSDIMAALATNANTTVGMAGETSKYSAAVVGSLYASQSTDDKMRAVEDWAAITGIMANAGIKGSMSGTAQRSMLTRLASLQQNANAAREGLGVDFVYQDDEVDASTGEVLHQKGQTRRLRDVLGDIRKRFQGDFDPEQLLDMTERLEGKEFSKQQREKLGKMIENVKANGGQMTDSDKATMASMLSGQEGMAAWLSVLMASTEDWEAMAAAIDNAHGKADEMSKIKMDTLEGDVKTLGSAFEALQLELFTGNGSSGLREFTQGLTEDIRYIQEALKDGFDIGDIGGLLAKVATQLKDKFLAFDGVGSILAGGALVMGLKKIYDLTMKLKDAAVTTRSWWQNAANGGAVKQGATLPNRPTTGSVAQSVGSMTVHAGSVVVNGKTVSQAAGGAAGQAARGGTTATAGGANAPRPSTATVPSTLSKVGGALKVGGGAAALTALFAAADVFSVRSTNEGRISETQAAYDQAQAEYDTIAADSGRRQELPQATQRLQQATADLRTTQKEAVQHNNESLFGAGGAVAGAAAGAAIGSIIPGLGTALGGIVGLALGAAGASVGADLGKEIGKNFDFDVLGWLTGKNDRNSSTERPVPKADWVTDSGKKFSELSTAERLRYRQNESATERANRESAEGAVQQQVAQQKHDEGMQQWQSGDFGDSALSKVSKDEINAAVEQSRRDKERKRTNFNQPFAGVDQSLSTDTSSLDEVVKASQESARENLKAKVKNEVDYLKSLFGFGDKSEIEKAMPEGVSELANAGISGRETQLANAGNAATLGAPVVMGETPDFSQMWADFNISDMLPDFSISEWLSEKMAEMPELPDFSQMWTDFNISDMLPDLNISEWFSESMATMEMPDLSTMLPDFSAIAAPATEAFSTITSSASEGWAAIQSEWSQLPGFFDGLWAGAGGAASAAGSAIASGINSAIGTIQSAWEGLSSWLSAKISSLSSMASSAVSAVTSFVGGGGVGHNATGTASWRGGLTEVNELGGEIIDLPSGARIYPHATTMKMLQQDMANGELDGFGGYFAGASTMSAGEFSTPSFPMLSQPELTTFPQAISFDDMVGGTVDNSTSTTNNNNNNNGVTISGNTFNVRKDNDINEIAFKLMELMFDSQANHAGM